MKTVTVPAQETALTAILDQAREEDLLIRAADGTEFVVSAVDDFDLEIVRTRRNAALMELLEERAGQSETIPLDEVKERLGLSS